MFFWAGAEPPTPPVFLGDPTMGSIDPALTPPVTLFLTCKNVFLTALLLVSDPSGPIFSQTFNKEVISRNNSFTL